MATTAERNVSIDTVSSAEFDRLLIILSLDNRQVTNYSLSSKQFKSHLAKQVLHKAVEESSQSVYWHCKLLFLYAVSVW